MRDQALGAILEGGTEHLEGLDGGIMHIDMYVLVDMCDQSHYDAFYCNQTIDVCKCLAYAYACANATSSLPVYQ